jgi:hypothetical protein
MTEVIQLCFRTEFESQVNRSDIEEFSERVFPDNISVGSLAITRGNKYAIAAINPRGADECNGSIKLGTALADNWDIPGSPYPSGSYAIFRNNNTYTELVSDVVGSRTIWYGFTDKLFAASTLQRAIVSFIQQYTPDPQTQAWMLSSGTLGPCNSWAKEIKKLQPNAVLSFNRESWDWEIDNQLTEFNPISKSTHEHYCALVRAIESTLAAWSVSPSTEILSLSGGYDSRVLLHHLSNKNPRIKTVTWGTPESPKTNLTDADIAKRLANFYDSNHQFKPIEAGAVPVDTVIERFIMSGEGRIDHLSGYLDGFALWKDLHSQGIKRIIRGDEGFGWIPEVTRFTTESDIRRAVGLTTLADIPKLSEFDIPEQTLPSSLQRRKEEHLSNWRDRLYHDARIPTTLAALNKLKSLYVELSNPLLSDEIISCVRHLPSELRSNKKLFIDYVDTLSPKIPYATSSAGPSLSAFLARADTVDYLKSELNCAISSTEISSELIQHISDRMRVSDLPSDSGTETSWITSIKEYAPRTVIDMLKRCLSKNSFPSYNRLAFRIVIASQMNQILLEDSNLLN